MTTLAAEAKKVEMSSGKADNKESIGMSYLSTLGSEGQLLAKSLRDAIFTNGQLRLAAMG